MSRRRNPKVGLSWEKRWRCPETGATSRTAMAEWLQYAKLRYTDPSTGKRTTKPLDYVTPEQAEQARGDLEAALRLGQDWSPSSDVVRVADVLELYIADIEAREVGYAQAELWRCVVLGKHLGNKVADSVTSATLSRYIAARRREPTRYGTPPKRATIRYEIRALRAAYRLAREERLIDCLPPALPRGKQLPNDGRPHRRLTEAEVRRLIAAAHHDYDGGRRITEGAGWLVQALAWSGRRPVAVLALEVRHCERLLGDLPRSEQLVYFERDKGGVARGWGVVTEPAREALIARCEEVGSGRLWQIQDSGALSRWFRKRLVAAAALDDVQPYDLRRFAVTQILRQCGGQARVAMKYTGHKNVSTLLRYAFAAKGEAELLAPQIGWSPEPLRLVRNDDRSQ